MTLTDTSPAPPPAEPGHPPRRRRRLVAAAVLVIVLLVAVVTAVLTRDRLGGPAPGPAEPAPTGAEGALPGADQPLSWAPPELEDPEVVEISADELSLRLDKSTDYELVMPDEPLPQGLSVYGGRNVVLVGGEIRIETGEGEGARGLYLRDQTGTVHVEGLRLGGTNLSEGINLDQRLGAVVQLQNILVDGVKGSREGHHADLLQSWAGPRQLLVDGLSGTTGYQGFFLLPNQFGDQAEPEVVDLRRVDIAGADSGSAYMLWRDDADWPVMTEDVWVDPTSGEAEDRRDFLWDRDGDDSWEGVSVGAPPEGQFVPEGTAGVDYVSPGYGSSG